MALFVAPKAISESPFLMQICRSQTRMEGAAWREENDAMNIARKFKDSFKDILEA